MSKILRTLLILLVIFALATWFFTVFKACSDKNKVTETIENTADVVGEKLTDAKEVTEESLEDLFDDDDAPTGNDSDKAADTSGDKTSDNESKSGTADDNQSTASTTNNNNSRSNNNGSSSNNSSNRSTANTSDGSWNYLVVTGNYLVEAYAEDEVKRLKNKGFNDAEMVTFDLSQYYTSIAGRYTSLTKARTMKNMATDKGFEAYVHKKRSKR